MFVLWQQTEEPTFVAMVINEAHMKQKAHLKCIFTDLDFMGTLLCSVHKLTKHGIWFFAVSPNSQWND